MGSLSRRVHYENDIHEISETTEHTQKDLTSSTSQVLSDSDISNQVTLTGDTQGVALQKDNSVGSFLDSKDGQEKMQEIMKVITHQDDFVNVDGTSTSAADAYDTMLERLWSVWNMRMVEVIPSTA